MPAQFSTRELIARIDERTIAMEKDIDAMPELIAGAVKSHAESCGKRTFGNGVAGVYLARAVLVLALVIAGLLGISTVQNGAAAKENRMEIEKADKDIKALLEILL